MGIETEVGGVSAVDRKHQRLADHVIDELLSQIRNGSSLPGQRLPPEPELAKQLGVSRGTLREATIELSRMGYLDVRQGIGTFVTVPDRRAVLRPFKTLLLEVPRLRGELLQFRRIIEPEVAALAAANATEQDVARLRGLVSKQQTMASKNRRTHKADANFHRELARIADNSLVLDFLDALREVFEEHRYEGPTDVTVEQHAAIVDAIAAGDEEAARRAAAKHLDWVMSGALADDFIV